MELIQILSYCRTNGISHDIHCDHTDTVAGAYLVVYRVELSTAAGMSIGIRAGNPQTALYNAFVEALNGLGINLFQMATEGAICPIGRYKGLPIGECPEEFVTHWATQERTGGAVDSWIAACEEFLNDEQVQKRKLPA